jgi:hypothetical protein
MASQDDGARKRRNKEAKQREIVPSARNKERSFVPQSRSGREGNGLKPWALRMTTQGKDEIKRQSKETKQRDKQRGETERERSRQGYVGTGEARRPSEAIGTKGQRAKTRALASPTLRGGRMTTKGKCKARNDPMPEKRMRLIRWRSQLVSSRDAQREGTGYFLIMASS